MIKGIDHIDIAVADVDGAIDLFTRMGFEVLRRSTHHDGSVELALPGPDQFILELHPAISQHLDGKLGLTHIAFRVDDPQKTHDELEARGVKFGPGWEKARFVPSTGRVLSNLLNSGETTECLGEWYVQFVGPDRKEPSKTYIPSSVPV
jgi:catechol 2,3-dioxygenase-like lactoylglutathione lyase family enzyme